jgi:hypothetical protein
MSPHVQISLALILCLPTFAILGALFCVYPRATRTRRRLALDLAICAVAVTTSVLAMRWGFVKATGVGGPLWKHVLATLLAYGTFLAVLGTGWLTRALVSPPRIADSAPSLTTPVWQHG